MDFKILTLIIIVIYVAVVCQIAPVISFCSTFGTLIHHLDHDIFGRLPIRPRAHAVCHAIRVWALS